MNAEVLRSLTPREPSCYRATKSAKGNLTCRSSMPTAMSTTGLVWTISKFMPSGNRMQVFPSFDHIHFHFLEGGEKRSRTGNVGPKEWIDFLDETGIDWTVVYPTCRPGSRPHHRRRLGDCCVPRLQQLAL